MVQPGRTVLYVPSARWLAPHATAILRTSARFLHFYKEKTFDLNGASRPTSARPSVLARALRARGTSPMNYS